MFLNKFCDFCHGSQEYHVRFVATKRCDKDQDINDGNETHNENQKKDISIIKNQTMKINKIGITIFLKIKIIESKQ